MVNHSRYEYDISIVFKQLGINLINYPLVFTVNHKYSVFVIYLFIFWNISFDYTHTLI